MEKDRFIWTMLSVLEMKTHYLTVYIVKLGFITVTISMMLVFYALMVGTAIIFITYS